MIKTNELMKGAFMPQVVAGQVRVGFVVMELRPCPHCGSKVLEMMEPTDAQVAAIYCNACPSGVQDSRLTMVQLVEAWNQRTPMKSGQPVEGGVRDGSDRTVSGAIGQP